MWELDYNESWVLKNWCFGTVVLEKTLESPLDWKEIQPVPPKGISPEYSLEGLMLKLQNFDHLMQRTNFKKDPDAGKDWGQEEKGTTEDEMVGWHHRLDGHEFWASSRSWWWTGNLACYSPCGHKESDTTEQLTHTHVHLWAVLETCIAPYKGPIVLGPRSTSQ